jgi:hypothetical protein
MQQSYNPIFHKDNTITYWDDSRGWFHRKHPSMIPRKIIETWRAQDRKKWGLAMLGRGFVKKNNVWQPAHELKEV